MPHGLTSHTLALHAGYSAYGGGGIGDGTTNDARFPVKVVGGYTFTSLACGRRHSCGILASNKSALCWGLDYNGQLGDGQSGNSQSAPVLVLGGLAFSQLSAGDSFTCGLTVGDGFARCWGGHSCCC